MQDKQRKERLLKKYIPEETIGQILLWQEKFRFSLRIANRRHTKHGDYRSPHGNKGHRISVNKNLNPFAFLITLVHEVAHLVTYEKYGNRVAPHGDQWKANYATLMSVFLDKNIFPGDLETNLKDYLVNPAASSCRDEDLIKVLRQYDDDPDLLLEELETGVRFNIYNGRQFVKGDRKRKRFVCTEVSSGKRYLFSPVTEVRVVG